MLGKKLYYNLYYALKILTPRPLQIQLRKQFVNGKLTSYTDVWPINEAACKPPERWTGWPDGKKFALVLTHDIEMAGNFEKTQLVAEIEENLGLVSSFNFVAKDYHVPEKLRRYLIDHGFEIGVHGLTHDQNPFISAAAFRKQSDEINRYLKEWGAVGFRCPSMYHDLELTHYLDIEYDASTFDTDPFEPQPDGVGTIFPFWVRGNSDHKGYVELPYTIPQDFLLFILMKERGIDTWKRKLDWIADKGGMALFITHPNYMNFDRRVRLEEYPARYYVAFLDYIQSAYEGQYWHVLPRDIARWWASTFKNNGGPPV